MMSQAESKFNKGVDYLKKGAYDKALCIFNQLLKEEPSNAAYWSERGVVYFHLGKKKEALNDLDKAIELEPRKAYRYSSRAYVKGHFKDLKGAHQDYEMAIELDPEDAIAYNNLGLIQEQMGYQKQAKVQFNKADELAGIKNRRGNSDLAIEGESIPARNIQKEIDKEESEKNLGKVIQSLFSKEGFHSFTSFVKNGFKLK